MDCFCSICTLQEQGLSVPFTARGSPRQLLPLLSKGSCDVRGMYAAYLREIFESPNLIICTLWEGSFTVYLWDSF